MASPTRASGDSQREIENKPEDVDERLDFRSDKFDPLLALYTPDIKLPIPNVKPLDNLSKYIALHVNKPSSSSTSTEDGAAPKVDKYWRQNIQITDRRFLPHQMPIRVEAKHRSVKNILTHIDKAENAGGFLGTLHKCLKEKIKVKVITRHFNNVRGHCEGYITAFDKYWNITLENVVEVWKRKRPKRAKALGFTGEVLKPSPELLKLFPKITRIKCNSNTETCQRNVKELMIRGEQIVLINLLELKS